MSKPSKRLLWIVVVLLLVTLACQAFAGTDTTSTGVTITQEVIGAPTTDPEQPQAEPTSAPEEPEALDTKPQPTPESPFPLPPDVQNFDLLGEEHVNFQTAMSLDEVIAFYRGEFGAMGLSERDLLTVIEDTAFSMVFDGSSNGKSLVIQGVVLSEDLVNVNIRYEDF